MKHHPNLIIYKVFKRYLSLEDQEHFDKQLAKYKDQRSKHFFNGMLKLFDIEILRKKPLLWEDIWLYNYCKYEVTTRIREDGLIRRYEREVFVFDDKEFKKLLKQRNR